MDIRAFAVFVKLSAALAALDADHAESVRIIALLTRRIVYMHEHIVEKHITRPFQTPAPNQSGYYLD